MIEANIEPWVGTAASVAGAAAVLGYFFGEYQEKVSQWVIDALAVKKRYKGVTNLAVGLALALPFAVIFAIQLGLMEGSLFLVGGLVSAIRASDFHDSGNVIVTTDDAQ